jgi:hypothetical protein
VCKTSKNLIDVPDKAYLDIYLSNNILIPNDSKCCKTHINRQNTFRSKDINDIEIVSQRTELNGYEVTLMLDKFRHTVNATKASIFDRFSSKKNITDDECIRYTGLDKSQFHTLVNTLKSLRASDNRSPAQVLATYLFRMRSGLDYKTIATLFSIEYFQSIANYCDQARKALLKDFVPNNLGVKHLTRNEWTAESTITVKKLFNVDNNQLALIADGTYMYCHKSKYNTLQRKQYSVQKNKHLGKPFVVCTPSGKIVDIYGMFPATDNDAKILYTILKSKEGADLKSLLKPNDHIILDRGFRDIIPVLQNKYKLNTHMPTCVPPRQKQLTAQQANNDRLVTKCRWIVEAVNGRLKTFKDNDKIHPNVSMPHVIDDLRISAALINKYFGDFGVANENELIMSEKMLSKVDKPNRLENIFAITSVDKKRKDYTKININTVPNFPKLDYDTIVNNITFGTYQLKQALSYIHENFNNPEYSGIEVYTDNSNIFDDTTRLLRAKIQSRHSSAKKYNSFITYSINTNDPEPIKDWICTCKSGKRTNGCCSHVASVIYYLSNVKYTTPKKATIDVQTIFPEHVIIDSSDESDGSDDISNQPIDYSDNSDMEVDSTQNSPRLYPDLSLMRE